MGSQQAHDAVVNPIISAALVVILAISLLALAYGVTRLSYGLEIGSDFTTKSVFAIAAAIAAAGVVGVPMLVIGPAVTSPWQLAAYFGSLFVLAVLASAVLVPLLFKPRHGG